MDVSSVQSSAKCNSDFSIERILSSDSGSGSSSEPPSWLCCTRYQPPRLPRSVSSACRSRRSGRHARVPFTAAQAAALEAAYARAPYLAPPALRALAAALQLRDDRIKIWFQNRRARERREKSTTIIPPTEVALPASPQFGPHGAMTAGSAWATHVTTDTNTLPIKVSVSSSPFVEDRSRFERNIMEFPRDLTKASTSVLVCNLSSEETFKDTRPDTPLDIETVED